MSDEGITEIMNGMRLIRDKNAMPGFASLIEAEARDMQERITDLTEQLSLATEALTELVRLKDLKDNPVFNNEFKTGERLRREYYTSKPLAWNAARAALQEDV